MAGYIGNIPVPQALRNYDVFTATSGQTVFNVKSYDPSFIDVYQNGVKLIDGDDYTATDGNTVVLASGAALNDVVEVISYTTFAVADVVPTSGGTFTGTVSFDYTGAIRVPVGTEAQRPSGVKGQFRFNDDEDKFEGYDGTEWGPLGGDLSSVAEDIIPDSDGTRDIGTVAKKFDQGRFNGITASNITDSDGVTVQTTYVTNGSAKAWVNFNGTGTIAARDSLNISSLTDNTTGDYTVNFSNAFGAADYAAHAQGSGNNDTISLPIKESTTPTLSSFRSGFFNTALTLGVDPLYVFSACHGDLA